jgi:hypothetical protein
MMTVFAVRSLRDLLRWWGGTFLSAGLISLTLSLSLFPIVNWGFNNLIPSKTSNNFELTALLVQLGIGDLSRELSNGLIMSVVIPASVLAVIGFALLLGSYLLSQSSPPSDVQLIEGEYPMNDTVDG